MTVTVNWLACPVVELRRYTLRPGGLPDLLAVFEHHLVEPQEQAGMTIGGTFADEDDADSFTWLRGFAGHDERLRALEAFYGGPVWARHSDAANATMLDSDNVFLLRPTEPRHPPAPAVPRGRVDATPRSERVLMGVCGLPADADTTQSWFAAVGHAGLEAVLGTRVAAWRTDPTPNGFARLPVRDERVLVWLAVFTDHASRACAQARLAVDDLSLNLEQRTTWRQIYRLSPTARSAHPWPEEAGGGSETGSAWGPAAQ